MGHRITRLGTALFGAIAGHEVGRKVSERIKVEILCRAEKDALQEAIVEYLSAASIKLANMIALATVQLNQFNKFSNEQSELHKDLGEDWIRRVSEEIEYRELQLRKINWGIQNEGMMADCEGSIMASALEAHLTVKSAGVVSANIPPHHRRYVSAIQDMSLR